MESDGQDVGHHVGGEQKSSVRCCVERGRPLVPVGNLRQPPAGAEAGQVSGEGELGLWAPQARGITVSGVARRSVAFLFSWCAALAVGLCGVLRRFEVVRRGRRAGREDDRRGVCGAHRRQLGEGRLVWFGHAPQLSGNLSSGAPQRCPGSPPPAPPRSPASPSPAAVQPPGTLGPYVDPAAIRRLCRPTARQRTQPGQDGQEVQDAGAAGPLSDGGDSGWHGRLPGSRHEQGWRAPPRFRGPAPRGRRSPLQAPRGLLGSHPGVGQEPEPLRQDLRDLRTQLPRTRGAEAEAETGPRATIGKC
mmetsp:Transcript_167995/g.534356  ORF Transcript_167995/g.534356 Transcript_167995/m.534356 type:complete len:304 (+) Transcript_167995:2141-3052(+)